MQTRRSVRLQSIDANDTVFVFETAVKLSRRFGTVLREIYPRPVQFRHVADVASAGPAPIFHAGLCPPYRNSIRSFQGFQVTQISDCLIQPEASIRRRQNEFELFLSARLCLQRRERPMFPRIHSGPLPFRIFLYPQWTRRYERNSWQMLEESVCSPTALLAGSGTLLSHPLQRVSSCSISVCFLR